MTIEDAIKDEKRFQIEVKIRLNRIIRLITSVNGNGKVKKTSSARFNRVDTSEHLLQR